MAAHRNAARTQWLPPTKSRLEEGRQPRDEALELDEVRKVPESRPLLDLSAGERIGHPATLMSGDRAAIDCKVGDLDRLEGLGDFPLEPCWALEQLPPVAEYQLSVGALVVLDERPVRLWNALDPERCTKLSKGRPEVLVEPPSESAEAVGDVADAQALVDVHYRPRAVAGGVERRGNGAERVAYEHGALELQMVDQLPEPAHEPVLCGRRAGGGAVTREINDDTQVALETLDHRQPCAAGEGETV